jgi:hypothetical protein
MLQRLGGIKSAAGIGDIREANMDSEEQHFGEEVCSDTQIHLKNDFVPTIRRY